MLDFQMCLTLLKQAEREAKKREIKGSVYGGAATIEIDTDGDGFAEIAPWWRGESYQQFHCSWDKLEDMLPTIRSAVEAYIKESEAEDG